MAYRRIPRKPPRWLELASDAFAGRCRYNTCGTVQMIVGDGNVDMLEICGTQFVHVDGDWYEVVKVND